MACTFSPYQTFGFFLILNRKKFQIFTMTPLSSRTILILSSHIGLDLPTVIEVFVGIKGILFLVFKTIIIKRQQRNFCTLTLEIQGAVTAPDRLTNKGGVLSSQLSSCKVLFECAITVLTVLRSCSSDFSSFITVKSFCRPADKKK